MDDTDAERAVAQLRTRLQECVSQLADVPPEPLAEYVAARRIALVFPRASRLVEIARVWRLGVLLIDTAGALYATSETTRAVDPGWPQHQAHSMEVRREYRGAALRGGFPRGTTININAVPIPLTVAGLAEADGPVFLSADGIRVRWSSHIDDDAARVIDSYLDERIDLLRHPPEGA